MKIRKIIWEEVEHEVEKITGKISGEKTRDFFRKTLNWFLVNHLHHSNTFSEATKSTIGELLKKESVNIQMGNVSQPNISRLYNTFKKSSRSDFCKKKEVIMGEEMEGQQYGVLFDKFANAIYNRVLFPELVRFAGEEWGIER